MTTSTKVVHASDLSRELELLRESYRLALEQMKDRIKNAEDKLSLGRVSHHDGFNLGANASDLQMLAGRIEFVENLIAFAK